MFQNCRLRGIQIAEVCQIFERINREGQPLDTFDIVVAKFSALLFLYDRRSQR
jgi:uncharacterized protein with ParB-like and HNH nuclease domain